MSDLQVAKAVARAFKEALFAADADGAASVLKRYCAPDLLWRGMHPFHEQRGPEAVAAVFWAPLFTAFTRPQRRPDIFIAGCNEIDGFASTWVVEMGHVMGLFDRPWLGIRPTKRIAMLRYVDFSRIEDGRIVETALFCDLVHLMMQAGQSPLPPQTGAHLVQPGPRTHAGLVYAAQDPARGVETLRIINAMLDDMGESEAPAADPQAQTPDYARHLAKTWHDDMVWWGPGGIGAAYTIPRYIEQHCAPFDDALSEGYRYNGHLCRLAEGDFGGFFGWANLTVRNAGGYLGMTAGANPADMRVVDIYRAQDGKLAENWIFIDILHYLDMQGLDVLGRLPTVATPG